MYPNVRFMYDLFVLFNIERKTAWGRKRVEHNVPINLVFALIFQSSEDCACCGNPER